MNVMAYFGSNTARKKLASNRHLPWRFSEFTHYILLLRFSWISTVDTFFWIFSFVGLFKFKILQTLSMIIFFVTFFVFLEWTYLTSKMIQNIMAESVSSHRSLEPLYCFYGWLNILFLFLIFCSRYFLVQIRKYLKYGKYPHH